MNKATIKKALENCEFRILSEEKDAIEFGQYTPCGEDWYERLEWSSAIKFLADLQRRIECFDIDEEVEIWIDMRGKRGVPSSIKSLLEDAEWKLEKLKELLKEVTK